MFKLLLAFIGVLSLIAGGTTGLWYQTQLWGVLLAVLSLSTLGLLVFWLWIYVLIEFTDQIKDK